MRGRDHSEDLAQLTDNIKMNLIDTGFGGVDWIGLTQERDQWQDLVST